MKYSQFNTVLPYSDKMLLYNSFSNQFLILEPLLKDLLFAAKAEDIDELRNVHATFFQALIDGGYLVENERDEVEEVKKVSRKTDLDQSDYRLTINPTMNCNFKCWYCYETHIKSSRMNEDIIERTNIFISNLVSTSRSLKRINLSWFGGEPLLYFYDIVQPIMEHFNKACAAHDIAGSITFTTNGFLINEKMIKIFEKEKAAHFQITMDGFGEDHDKIRYVSETRGSYKEIIHNIKLLIRNKFNVTMRINYTADNILNCDRIIEDLMDLDQVDKSYMLVDFHKVWQETDANADLHFMQKADNFRNAGFRVSSHLSPNNVRDSCYADKLNSAVINYNGEVFKCTARDFTTGKREGYINESGEIIWEKGSPTRRMEAKFHNKPCLSCRILPLCNGGCSQHAIEHLNLEDYCVYSFDEKEKDKVVLNKFKEITAVH